MTKVLIKKGWVIRSGRKVVRLTEDVPATILQQCAPRGFRIVEIRGAMGFIKTAVLKTWLTEVEV